VVTLRTGSLQEGLELRIEPSRLLYAIDRTAYVEFLSSSREGVPTDVTSGDSEEISDLSIELRRAPEPEPAVAEAVSSYEGVLSPLKEGFDEYFRAIGVIASDDRSSHELRDSLLAATEPHLGLDWTVREPLVAAMKVALRRTLVRFGIDREQAESKAEQLTSWLKIYASDLYGIESRIMSSTGSSDRSIEDAASI